MCCDFICLQVLQEQTSIPGSDLNLIYLSSRAAGYKPVLKVTMTQTSIPFNLMKVRSIMHLYGCFGVKIFVDTEDYQLLQSHISGSTILWHVLCFSRFTWWLQWWVASSRNGFLPNQIYPIHSSGTRRTPMANAYMDYLRQLVSLHLIAKLNRIVNICLLFVFKLALVLPLLNFCVRLFQSVGATKSHHSAVRRRKRYPFLTHDWK